MGRGIMGAAIVAAIGVSSSVDAGISYSVSGSEYAQNFDNVFPVDKHPSNDSLIPLNNAGHVQSVITSTGFPGFTNGWVDDTTSNGDRISAPGWHLYHQALLATTLGGDNGHHHLRYGSGGTGSSGAYYVWAMPATFSEKALGILSTPGTNTGGGRAYIALQLVNDTNTTLTSFTVTYDGEQWRNGGSNGVLDGFDFQYSLTKTDANWFESSGYDGIADSFLSVKDGSTIVGLDGNLDVNRVADITHTISDIEWLPGTELWIRWRDRELVNVADDSIAIDNVRFSAAVPEPTTAALLLVGGAAAFMRRHRRE